MSTKPQLELFLENENGTQQVAYPLVEADHVSLSNGMDIDTMIAQDVSMPTVAHEDLSFKVGVGDQDVSSAIVDGSVAEMAIKGQTYQNILPEPSLRNSMTNGKTMQKINEGYDSVEVVDGVGKSAILKGNTLVNIFDVALPTEIKNNHDITLSHQVNANETYTFIVEAESTSEKYQGGFITTNGGANGWNGSVDNGISKFTVTTSEATNKVRFSALGASNTVQIKKCMIIKGDYSNQDIPFFTGMQSVKMPVLSTVGKNLFDKNKVTKGYYLTEQGGKEVTLPLQTTFYQNEFIKVKNDMTYIISETKEAVRIHFYDRNKKYIKRSTNVIVNTPTVFDSQDFGYIRLSCGIVDLDNIQLEEGTTPTTYEPYKTNILSTPEEVVLRSLPNGVCDTLNLNTGEYVQRIGEHVLDGTTNNASRDWNICWTGYSTNTLTFEGYRPTKTLVNTNGSTTTTIPKNFICDKVKVLGFGSMWQNGQAIDREFSITTYTGGQLIFVIEKSKLASMDVSGFKQWLSQNPVTIQYELATPIIKTVDLSSSGNWEKVVFDGSENWSVTSESSNNNAFFRSSNTIPNNVQANSNNITQKVICDILTSLTQPELCNKPNDRYGISLGWANSDLCIRHESFPLTDEGLQQFKQYLSQNPITVWYQTTTHKDSTQVKQPIFFKDGHIQLSSGADNSLIPTLDYQAKTSNSYVMNLMKANTPYTIKATQASGKYTLNGNEYYLVGNGTINSGSGANFLVITQGSATDLMFLEGNLKDKTIPYFKGIKSAFEDESKIEVLSTGKNLFDGVFEQGYLRDATGQPVDNNQNNYEGVHSVNYIPIKENTIYSLSVVLGSEYNGYNTSFYFYDENKNYLGYVANANKARSKENAKYMRFRIFKNGGSITKEHCNSDLNVKFQVEEGSVITTHEPYRSNNTKIPLLSSLQTVVENVHMTQGSLDNTTGAELVDTTCVRSSFIEVVEDTAIVFRNGGLERMAHILAYDSEKRYIEKLGIVSSCSIPKDRGIKYVRIFMNMSNYDKLKISKSVKAYKGLASLPNGVRDEIILDRENNKAKIIQRVGKVTYDGTDVWGAYTVHQNNVRIQTTLPNCVRRDTAGFIYAICDKLPSVVWNYSWLQNYNLVTVNLTNLHLQLSDTTMTKQQMLSWLTQNPITVQYELAEPVVTEVDLSGFPYIYKEGHIFLNGEIASVTEIKYSINQSHMIEASNQDLIRHQKEIDYLYKLIGEYVRVDYKNTLLSLNLELK